MTETSEVETYRQTEHSDAWSVETSVMIDIQDESSGQAAQLTITGLAEPFALEDLDRLATAHMDHYRDLDLGAQNAEEVQLQADFSDLSALFWTEFGIGKPQMRAIQVITLDPDETQYETLGMPTSMAEESADSSPSQRLRTATRFHPR